MQCTSCLLGRKEAIKGQVLCFVIVGGGEGGGTGRSVLGKHRVGSNRSSVAREGSILEGKFENRAEGTR